MKNVLTIFENGSQKRFKPCGCDRGKVIKKKTTISDIYSISEVLEMDLDGNDVLDEKYICENCEKELEEI